MGFSEVTCSFCLVSIETHFSHSQVIRADPDSRGAMETCAGIWILLFALRIQGRTHEINTRLNKSARFDQRLRAPARRFCRNARVSCVHGRGSSRRRVLPHMMQSETTFKVFSVFIGDPNSCSRVLRGGGILNLPELQVDGAISEPRGCLQVPPYLTGMATGGHGGFLNPN